MCLRQFSNFWGYRGSRGVKIWKKKFENFFEKNFFLQILTPYTTIPPKIRKLPKIHLLDRRLRFSKRFPETPYSISKWKWLQNEKWPKYPYFRLSKVIFHFWDYFHLDIRSQVPEKRFEKLNLRSKRWISGNFRIFGGMVV